MWHLLVTAQVKGHVRRKLYIFAGKHVTGDHSTKQNESDLIQTTKSWVGEMAHQSRARAALPEALS